LTTAADVPAAAEAPAEVAPQKRSRLRRLGHWLLRHPPVAAVTAVIALGTSAASLTYSIWPDLRPDPQVQLSGSLRVAMWEPGVTYGAYLMRTNQLKVLKAKSSNEQKTPGYLYYLQVEAAGLKRRTSDLHAYLYDAKTRERFRETTWHSLIKYGTTSDRFLTPVWVQPPRDEGAYFVRFELRARGILLAITDSPRFSNCHDKGCGA
jgi:hypothetical protein